MSPTARSLAYLRAAGWQVCTVERWLPVPGKNIRQDAYGFADLLGCHPKEKRIALVQVTTLSNLPSRVAKVRSKAEARNWLLAGGLIFCHGWCRRGGRWSVKIIEVKLSELDELETAIITRPKRKRRATTVQGELWD